RDPDTGEVWFEAETYITPAIARQLSERDWGRDKRDTRLRVHVPVVPLAERLVGRTALETITHPETGEVLVEEGANINRDTANAIERAGLPEARIRSILTCRLPRGVCATCYGHDMAANHLVEIGE